MSKKGLGKGLWALIPDTGGQRESVNELAIDIIDANPRQPRKDFDQAKLDELAASIREHGVVQPVIVRPRGERYEIVAGERRWRAARLAGLEKVPVIVRDFSEAEAMEIALIENLQREDLNPLEEAEAYRVLMEEFGLTQEQLAQRVGKSRPQIANALRLLHLEDEVKQELSSGRLSVGHAKVLLGLEDPAERAEMAGRIVREALSVRDLEALIEVSAPKAARSRKKAAKKQDPDLGLVEAVLRTALGTPVKIVPGKPRGRIEISYFGLDDLQRLVDLVIGERQAQSHGLRPPAGPFRV